MPLRQSKQDSVQVMKNKGDELKLKTILVLFLAFSGVFAQTKKEGDFLTEAPSFIAKPLDTIIKMLDQYHLLPDLDIENDPSGVKAFFMFGLMVWMVLDIYFQMSTIINIFVTFAITSFFFNVVNYMFAPETVQQIFTLVFSALFIYVFTDFILKYVFGLTQKTKLLLKLSVTAIAVAGMSFTDVYRKIAGYVTGASTLGYIIFFAFLIVMRFFNMFFSMMRLSTAKDFRRGGAQKVDKYIDDLQKEATARRKVGGKP